MTFTTTLVALEVSEAVYDEIASKLKAADYEHAFIKAPHGVTTGLAIAMDGIALVKAPKPKPKVITVNGRRCEIPAHKTYLSYADIVELAKLPWRGDYSVTYCAEGGHLAGILHSDLPPIDVLDCAVFNVVGTGNA